ncbi:MAG: family 16 glycosylhydrolase [Nocardioides sp.]
MTTTRAVRRLLLTGLVVLLGLALPAAAGAYQAPGPIHAGNTYGWYRNHLTRYEFIGAKPQAFKVHGRGVVRDQHGMLTLNTTRHGSVSATLDKRGHAYGRWEIRLRSRRFATNHTNFRVVTDLIPAGDRKQHCGARDIGLENYRFGRHWANFYIHTLPHRSFRAFQGRNLSNDRWHTFAVEVTPHHISWFVDAHVVRTERRDAALSGVPLTVRFKMKALRGHTMNPSRMQMDWLRYWSDEYPSQKSIAAPRPHQATYAKAC